MLIMTWYLQRSCIITQLPRLHWTDFLVIPTFFFLDILNLPIVLYTNRRNSTCGFKICVGFYFDIQSIKNVNWILNYLKKKFILVRELVFSLCSHGMPLDTMWQFKKKKIPFLSRFSQLAPIPPWHLPLSIPTWPDSSSVFNTLSKLPSPSFIPNPSLFLPLPSFPPPPTT